MSWFSALRVPVIPANAGIQRVLCSLRPRLRGDDNRAHGALIRISAWVPAIASRIPALSRNSHILCSIAGMVLATAMALTTTGCGFHLRGSGGTAVLPASLASVRVVTDRGVNEPLAAAVREAISQAGAKVVEAGDVPTLTILSEQTESQVASVRTTTGKASEYTLRYALSFRLDGEQSLPEQTIRLQRDYSFDPERVLAKEQEERELLRNMRLQAAQQIVRRLARSTGSTAR